MKRNLIYSALTACALLCGNAAQALVVTPESDANLLANNIAGSGITISNVNYIGASGASGLFTDGLSSGLGFDTGVLLTTGSAAGAVGPNNVSNYSVNNSMAGDSDLDSLSGVTTNDATSLSFDFEFDGGSGGDIFFNFIFASEEYNEYVGSTYNDVFGLFVNGTNIALLPDTTPVTINNVNNTSNAAYFNDNAAGTHNIQYDGFTKSLSVSMKGLSAGLHTMKFAIADGTDFAWDSGIFIQAGSFSDTPTDVPEPAPMLLLSLGLIGLGFARKRANT
ncbi:choice-of-anchor L family PEP-CTERM protein [Simiduia aestuariiviva]|uniref:Ice-binding protein C-terminal domain-containing protein n=1 Tax=Simiduia aestuariiviva TaxID=1510459 RepID=A0A839UUL5_9GAMM|nr:choice-of-anchor L domain-containing protein [Simiduia aestuariiviva]MBB3169055.1 hypothetical protein [Simiduia aestuariiviva]